MADDHCDLLCLDLQTAEGKWPESASTGTGFPNVFYLTYAMYRDYFPLLALASLQTGV